MTTTQSMDARTIAKYLLLNYGKSISGSKEGLNLAEEILSENIEETFTMLQNIIGAGKYVFFDYVDKKQLERIYNTVDKKLNKYEEGKSYPEYYLIEKEDYEILLDAADKAYSDKKHGDVILMAPVLSFLVASHPHPYVLTGSVIWSHHGKEAALEAYKNFAEAIPHPSLCYYAAHCCKENGKNKECAEWVKKGIMLCKKHPSKETAYAEKKLKELL